MNYTNQPDSTDIRMENGLIVFDNYLLYKQRAEEARDYLMQLDVTPESEQECKRTVATARKISDQLNQEKIRMKKAVLEPYVAYEDKVKEIIGIITEGENVARDKLKAIDDQRREAKKAEIIEESQIRGEDLTDDAKLFTCGIPLTEQDIRHIVKRNSGNRTMINLAAKYAKQNNLNTFDLYKLADHSEELESCETVNNLAARYCDQWLGNDEGFRQLDAYFNMQKGTAESL